MDEIEVRWSLEGPLDVLREAAKVARIDPNAIIPGKVDAELIYPSFFCTSRANWVKALAYLYVRNIQFRLFLFGLTEMDEERWRFRILPAMDLEMSNLMREIDAAEARQIENLGDRIGRVADRLRTIDWDDDDLVH